MRIFIYAFIFLGLVGQAATTSAQPAEQPRYYDVELIIFENLEPGARSSERWPANSERTPPEEQLVEIGGPYPGPIPDEFIASLTFKPLSAGAYRLQKEVQAIEESATRRVLVHTGWTQPGLSKDKAITVHFNRHIPAFAAARDAEVASEAETAAATPLYTTEAGELDALVRVILSRYLHVEADLLFQLEKPEATFTPQFSENEFSEGKQEVVEEPSLFRFQQTRRRIRSTELHYLDHPVIGMLILITPHEVSTEAAEKKR